MEKNGKEKVKGKSVGWKLSPEQKAEIVVSLALGERSGILAKKYHVSTQTIFNVARGQSRQFSDLIAQKKKEWLAVAWNRHISLTQTLYDQAIRMGKETDKLSQVALSFGLLTDKLRIAMLDGQPGSGQPSTGPMMNIVVFQKDGQKLMTVSPNLQDALYKEAKEEVKEIEKKNSQKNSQEIPTTKESSDPPSL